MIPGLNLRYIFIEVFNVSNGKLIYLENVLKKQSVFLKNYNATICEITRLLLCVGY